MALAKRYREFDVAVEDLFRRARNDGHSIPCERGCDACCYDIALASHVEMGVVIEAVRTLPPEDRRKIRARLSEWLARATRAGIDPASCEPDVPTWFRARLKCPLLDGKTHDCMVYADRPLACRGHHIVDEPAESCTRRHELPGRPLLTEAFLLAGQCLADIIAASAPPGESEVPIAMGLIPTMLLLGWDAVDNGEPDPGAFILRRMQGQSSP